LSARRRNVVLEKSALNAGLARRSSSPSRGRTSPNSPSRGRTSPNSPRSQAAISGPMQPRASGKGSYGSGSHTRLLRSHPTSRHGKLQGVTATHWSSMTGMTGSCPTTTWRARSHLRSAAPTVVMCFRGSLACVSRHRALLMTFGVAPRIAMTRSCSGRAPTATRDPRLASQTRTPKTIDGCGALASLASDRCGGRRGLARDCGPWTGGKGSARAARVSAREREAADLVRDVL
jgi:hypothetical protein